MGYLRLSLIRRLASVEIDNQNVFFTISAFHLLFEYITGHIDIFGPAVSAHVW
jgi:hypothetical protein